jgi:hypothetical protein
VEVEHTKRVVGEGVGMTQQDMAGMLRRPDKVQLITPDAKAESFARGLDCWKDECRPAITNGVDGVCSAFGFVEMELGGVGYEKDSEDHSLVDRFESEMEKVKDEFNRTLENIAAVSNATYLISRGECKITIYRTLGGMKSGIIDPFVAFLGEKTSELREFACSGRFEMIRGCINGIVNDEQGISGTCSKMWLEMQKMCVAMQQELMRDDNGDA